MDQRTRKLMTIHKALHPREDVDRMYVSRKEGGRPASKMKRGKRYLTDGMELPNQDKIRTLGEKEIYKYLGILNSKRISQEN